MENAQKQQLLFTQLVAMFHVAGMQHLGKLKSPLTDKVERDLHAAQETIDILDMLKEKTRGNLTPEENRLLGQILQDLKLNYVDEKSRPEPRDTQTAGQGSEGEKPA